MFRRFLIAAWILELAIIVLLFCIPKPLIGTLRSIGLTPLLIGYGFVVLVITTGIYAASVVYRAGVSRPENR